MGFQHFSQRSHKLAGMAAAAKSAKTPEHLRAHLERLTAGVESTGENDRNPATKEPVSVVQHADEVPASTSVSDSRQAPAEAKPSFKKGDQVALKDGTKATVVFTLARAEHQASGSNGLNVVRLKTADGRRLTVKPNQIQPIQAGSGTPKGWKLLGEEDIDPPKSSAYQRKSDGPWDKLLSHQS